MFGLSQKELHVREIERRSGLSIGTVRQELQKLLKMELELARRDGNRLYYSANKEHPLFSDIRNLVLKTSGIVEPLKGALDIYCRLRNLGIPKGKATHLCRNYEGFIFKYFLEKARKS